MGGIAWGEAPDHALVPQVIQRLGLVIDAREEREGFGDIMAQVHFIRFLRLKRQYLGPITVLITR